MDIGAYHGGWARKMHKYFPESGLFLVEANKDHAPDLEKLKPSKYAIALMGEKQKKSVKYYVTKEACGAGNSIYKEQTPAYDDCEVCKLPMVTLDSLVKKHKLQHIDFIKIDTQGSELNIIKGGLSTVAQAPFISQVISTMEKLKFRLYDITEIHYLPAGEMAQVDLLFVKQTSKFLKKCQTSSV